MVSLVKFPGSRLRNPPYLQILCLISVVSLALLVAPSASADEETIPAATVEAPTLPIRLAEDDWKPLWEWSDGELQSALARAVDAKPAWKRLARQKRLGVGLVDLADPGAVRFASINGEHMMYAASLPKIGILLAAYVAFEEGSLVETPELRQRLTDMIRVSSNSAATEMIDLLGFEKISSVLTDPRYELYDPEHGGGIWVGKRFAKQGRRIGDPLANISHAASPSQVCRFYYLLATGRVISPERSRQILEHLSAPGLNHKFVNTLRRRAPLARLFRKSGSWQRWHSDSVLVWGPTWRRYILVGMVESDSGEAIMRELAGAVEALLEPGDGAATAE